MNRQVLSIVALILLLLSAFNSTTMARTLPSKCLLSFFSQTDIIFNAVSHFVFVFCLGLFYNYQGEGISASIKVGVSGSVSRQARKKGPGAPGKHNR